MMTAMQTAKLEALNKLLQAQQLIQESRSLICMGTRERDSLRNAYQELDFPISMIAPMNSGPAADD